MRDLPEGLRIPHAAPAVRGHEAHREPDPEDLDGDDPAGHRPGPVRQRPRPGDRVPLHARRDPDERAVAAPGRALSRRRGRRRMLRACSSTDSSMPLETGTLWALVDERARTVPDALACGRRARPQTDVRRVPRSVGALRRVPDVIGRCTGHAVSVWQLPTCLEAIVLVGVRSCIGVVQIPVLPIYRERSCGSSWVRRSRRCSSRG